MQKVNFILILLILSGGCSVFRIKENKNYRLPSDIITGRSLEIIAKQNITKNSFFISKVEFIISSENETLKLKGSIKFQEPEKYLISIKSIAGIEAARIFISDDTILVNDRINRKQYNCSPQYVKRKYGITPSVLRVIMGDFINDNLNDNDQAKCLDGKLYIEGSIGGIRVNYVIDCKKGKSILAIYEKSLNGGKIEIQYSDFLKSGDIITPGKIEIKDLQRKTTIEISIKKIEHNWNGNIEFIPGNRYKIIKLF